MRVRFGSCVLDTRSHELRRAGALQHLSLKAFSFLEFLLERRPSVVTKAEIHDRVWPKTFVSDSGLTRLVSEVRSALGEDADLLRTVHGLGYAFSGDAKEEEGRLAPSRFYVLLGDREIPLLEGDNVLGRDGDSAIVVNSARASRRHARIAVSDVSATIEDLRSKNGTYLRGQRLLESTPLVDGDEIAIGPVLIIFRAGSTASTETDSSLTPPSEPTARISTR